jgi:hypothetical protein
MTLVEHSTAMHRTSLSQPESLALADGILRAGLSMFDYGCSCGSDVCLLRPLAYETAVRTGHSLRKAHGPKQTS